MNIYVATQRAGKRTNAAALPRSVSQVHRDSRFSGLWFISLFRIIIPVVEGHKTHPREYCEKYKFPSLDNQQPFQQNLHLEDCDLPTNLTSATITEIFLFKDRP